MEKIKGLLFDIQGFSVHDGPGCRTTVFLKGCGMRCPWCANPEGMNPFPEMMYFEEKCKKGEYSCREACSSAITVKEPGGFIKINRKNCEKCGVFSCEKACRYDAIRKTGYYVTADEIIKRIQRDRNYWGSSGGLTLSGGEPLLQQPFAGRILKSCHDSYIHTAVETCGHVPWECFTECLEHIDWIFYDLKHMDSGIHKEATGVFNELILENARKIAALGNRRVIFRVALIPGYNDTVENITATARFIRSIGKDEINILPFHRLGSSKYQSLGRRDKFMFAKPCPPEQTKKFEEIFKAHGIKCYSGNSTPF